MTSDWPWPEDLDAVRAAPAQHRVLLENADVRVLDTRIEPGERTPVHTHCWPAVHCVLTWSDFVRRDAQDGVLLDTRTAGSTGARTGDRSLGRSAGAAFAGKRRAHATAHHQRRAERRLDNGARAPRCLSIQGLRGLLRSPMVCAAQ